MSNLGDYQRITTLIKQLGGPKVARALAAAGAVLLVTAGGAAHAGYQKAAPKVKDWIAKLGQPDALAGSVYNVRIDAEDDQGLAFQAGDTFRVLERDGDAVLIELVGNDDNPWAVSAAFLARISDFPADIASSDADS